MHPLHPFLTGLRNALPQPTKRLARRAMRTTNTIYARLRFGVGVSPLSLNGGFDRGIPAHRYYLEQFLQTYAADIRGHCLEFQEDSYTSRFGGANVLTLDILDKEAGNPQATMVADLTRPNEMPGELFDCIICTYVLHVILEVDKALAELYRLLKPGGVLLVAVPHFSRSEPQYQEMWRFTPEGLRALLARAFGAENVQVATYGNSLIAAGTLRGLVVQEFTQAELAQHDPSFAVGVFARAQKHN